LLVVSGQSRAPAATQAQLDQRRYADVYAMLHQAVVPESKLFKISRPTGFIRRREM
jgi:hypothetical protein